MNVVSADSLTQEIMLVQSVDNQIGSELQGKSKPALLAFTEDRLFQLEKEKSSRDVELISRDVELIRNIEIINDIYGSYRYRIGKFLVRPIELVLLKLGIIKEPQNFSKANVANAKMD